MKNDIFMWIVGLTGTILLIPFVAMRFTRDVNWNFFDFIVAAVLIFGFASLYVFLARRFKEHRLILGLGVVFAFLWLWVELAVGVFTRWGS